MVFAPCTPGSVEARPVVDLSPAEWDRPAEGPVRDGLAAFRHAHPRLKAAGGRFVLDRAERGDRGRLRTGAAGHTAAEALRALGKSAARRWARDGVSVHLLTPTVFALDPAAEALRGTDVDRSEAALGADSMSPEAVADVVLLLCSPRARHLTGSTFALDGGALMVP
ncbi:SDR family oxidoreductase [Yinghuangia aomiensis]